MTKYLLLLAALMLVAGCGNDPVDKDPVDDNSQPDIDTTPEWTTYAGLEWSTLSENKIKWQKAIDYCEAMDARLPNINELRKIIINCPNTEYGGACEMSDPDCLEDRCWSEDCGCDGSAESYSALGDSKSIWLWSSSSYVDSMNGAWVVSFDDGSINGNGKDSIHHARCVR